MVVGVDVKVCVALSGVRSLLLALFGVGVFVLSKMAAAATDPFPILGTLRRGVIV